MNILNMDISKYMPDIIDAYTDVLGQEYREIIEEKFSKIISVVYKDPEGVYDYAKFLKKINLDDDNIPAYYEFYNNEKSRRENIYNQKKKELFEQIENELNIESIKELDIEEKVKLIFNNSPLIKSNIEYFSEEDEEELKSDNEIMKFFVARARLEYFRSLGISDIDGNYTLEDTYKQYERLIKQEEVKKLIPSSDLVQKISKLREDKIEEGNREFILTSENIKDVIEEYDNAENLKKFLYNNCKHKTTQAAIVKGQDQEVAAYFLLCTIRDGNVGEYDYVWLHELLHIIEFNVLPDGNTISGFDIISNTENNKNPYFEKRRAYERLNECIVDCLALEALEKLHKKGIFMFETEEMEAEDVGNRNTSAIVKSMIKPLFTKYREPLIKARITGKLEEFINIIGEENFEMFNDIINKVDYLTVQGLERKLENEELEDDMVIEYKKQKARLEEVYSNMKSYQAQSEERVKKDKKSIGELDRELAELKDKEQQAKNLYEQYAEQLKEQFNQKVKEVEDVRENF